MSDYKDTPLLDRLRNNILFNWPHLAHYGDDMCDAADEIEQLTTKLEAQAETINNLRKELRECKDE